VRPLRGSHMLPHWVERLSGSESSTSLCISALGKRQLLIQGRRAVPRPASVAPGKTLTKVEHRACTAHPVLPTVSLTSSYSCCCAKVDFWLCHSDPAALADPRGGLHCLDTSRWFPHKLRSLVFSPSQHASLRGSHNLPPVWGVSPASVSNPSGESRKSVLSAPEGHARTPGHGFGLRCVQPVSSA